MKYLSFIKTDFDKTVSLFVIIISLLMLSYVLYAGRIMYIFPPVFVIMSSFVWLKYRNKKKFRIDSLVFRENNKAFLLATISFFLLLSAALLIFYLRSNIYYIPFTFFIMISLMVGCCTLGILYSSSNSKIMLILIQIYVLVVLSGVSQLYVFPNVVGSDPFYHQLFTQNIVNSGFIIKDSVYSNIASLHIINSALILFANINYKLSITILSIVNVSMIITVTFLIGKFLYNEKIALMAALFIAISNYVIHFVFIMIPSSLGLLFAVIILFLILSKDVSPIKYVLLIFLMMVALILTHPLVSVFMGLLLMTFWFLQKTSNLFGFNTDKKVSSTLAVFFITAMFSWWIYASHTLDKISDKLVWGFSVDKVLSHASATTSYLISIPFTEQLFFNLGVFLFFSLAIIGFYYMISKNDTCNKNVQFSLAFVLILPLCIAFISLILQRSILEDRWWQFAEVTLAIPLSISILLLTNFSNYKLKSFALTIFTVILALIMILSPTASGDLNSVFPNMGISYGFTTSEISAAEFVNGTKVPTYTDYDYTTIFKYVTQYKYVKVFDQYILDKTFPNNSFKIFRNRIITSPFRLGGSIYKLDHDPDVYLSDYNEIYENNMVKIYL